MKRETGKRETGEYVASVAAGHPVQAFSPVPLPPDPPLDLSAEDLDLMERANRAVGRLDGIADVLPDRQLFISFYVLKEALLSSQIEGTQSSLQELLLFEIDDEPRIPPLDDVREMSNYIAALNHGTQRLRRMELPVSSRFIRDSHRILLDSGRGRSRTPGEFRRTQVWLGGTRRSPQNATFVPPPPHLLEEGMADLERFIHDRTERTPTLIKVALAHAQFETLHPFLDGNGRVGRLMIPLMLCAEGALQEPVLYLSLFFKTNRDEYYARLQAVRSQGDWEGWLRFFLQGVLETAGQAVAAARRLLSLFQGDREKVESLGRAAGSALRVHEYLQRHPILRTPKAAADLGLSPPTVDRAIHSMEDLGILSEITGKRRRREYAYTGCLAILGEGTEPLDEQGEPVRPRADQTRHTAE